jgi:hypothetical protein
MHLFLLWTQHIFVEEIAIPNTLTDGNMHVNKRSGEPQHASCLPLIATKVACEIKL